MRSRLQGYWAGCVFVGLALAMAVNGPARAEAQKPNILVIMGDDIGQTNISAYSFGVVGYKTPNIDRIAHEGMMFTDYYAENSCTAAARHSSPVRRRSAQGCRRSAFPARRSDSRRATSRSPRR